MELLATQFIGYKLVTKLYHKINKIANSKFWNIDLLKKKLKTRCKATGF